MSPGQEMLGAARPIRAGAVGLKHWLEGHYQTLLPKGPLAHVFAYTLRMKRKSNLFRGRPAKTTRCVGRQSRWIAANPKSGGTDFKDANNTVRTSLNT